MRKQNKIRNICVSDLHGYYKTFLSLLDKVAFNPNHDKLFLLGDFVDYGPSSIPLLIRVCELQKTFPLSVFCILGNHEYNFLISLDYVYEHNLTFEEFVKNAPFVHDYQTFTGNNMNALKEMLLLPKSTQLELYTWLKALPHYYQTKEYVFTHAGYDARFPLKRQPLEVLLYGLPRHRYYSEQGYKDYISISGHTPTTYLNFRFNKLSNTCNIYVDALYHDKYGVDCGIWQEKYAGKMGALILVGNEPKFEYVSRKD